MIPTSPSTFRGPRFLWLAAGRPVPVQTDGASIPTRDFKAMAERERRRAQRVLDLPTSTAEQRSTAQHDLARIDESPICASCGEPASYTLDDAISDSFTTVKNANRAWSHGGRGLCTACVWACKTLALRCALFFARLPDEHGPGGIAFHPIRPVPDMPVTRPDPLAVLLNPPPAPFVAGLPLYGVDHGGEANIHRAIWPHPLRLRPDVGPAPVGTPRTMPEGPALFIPRDPLIKLQSKHTALYTQVSCARDRYRLQVDDTADVTVDVPLWRRLRPVCDALLLDMRQNGVGAEVARASITMLRLPKGAPLRILGTWSQRTAPLKPYADAPWWGLFTNLLLMPDLVRTERPAQAAGTPASAPKTKTKSKARPGARPTP